MSSILEVSGIVKVYPGTVALNNISVSFKSGQVHAVVGKNGSGKSTLLKILSGAVCKTEGSIILDGKKLSINCPKSSIDLGISMVYQEMSVLPYMSVAENIFLSNLPMKNKLMIDRKSTILRARKLLNELEIDIDPNALVGSLSIGQRQMVEIAKAMSTNPKVMLLDEPTSAITNTEVEALFNVIRRLKDKDVIVIYVSHRLHELWKIADVCTVFRDGEYIGTREMATLAKPELIHMMFGEVRIKKRPKNISVMPETVLQVKNISYADKLHNLSFELKKGEVLGIAGMLGSGRTELLQAIYGVIEPDAGEVYIFGERILHQNPIKMKIHGVAMTTEDRQKQGLVLFQSVSRNLLNPSIETTGDSFIYDHKKAIMMAEKQREELEIKVKNFEYPVSSLSGGNQQKVVVGGWLNTNPRIIMFDEPSRGIDVSAKQQIFQIIWDQAMKGISSIMVSTELEELLEVCHRILVLKNGRFIGEITNPDNVTIEQLYTMSMGGKVDGFN